MKPYEPEHNSHGHSPQEAMAEVKSHVDLQIEVAGMGESGNLPA